jgi:hypothetical protein
MENTPTPKDDRALPDDPNRGIRPPPEKDIYERQEQINESDASYMQAPDPWPPPPDEDSKDA